MFEWIVKDTERIRELCKQRSSIRIKQLLLKEQELLEKRIESFQGEKRWLCTKIVIDRKGPEKRTRSRKLQMYRVRSTVRVSKYSNGSALLAPNFMNRLDFVCETELSPGLELPTESTVKVLEHKISITVSECIVCVFSEHTHTTRQPRGLRSSW